MIAEERTHFHASINETPYHAPNLNLKLTLPRMRRQSFAVDGAPRQQTISPLLRTTWQCSSC
jgi:hypothetical protein